MVDTPAFSPRGYAGPHRHRAILRIIISLATAFVALAAAPSIRADDTIVLALHLAPNSRITAVRTSTHVVSYQMNHTLMALLGSRAAPTTLVDTRTAAIDVGPDGSHVSIDDESVRRYGGDSPSDKSSVTRHDKYVGAIAADGVRSPAQDALPDAGDGALDELPQKPVAVGASWSFTRPVLLDRSLAQASMTYTDTFKSVSQRAGHVIATIAVAGTGMANPASDLEAKGFGPATYTLSGTAEFDVTAGLPGQQSYTAHVLWSAHPMFTHIGLDFLDTFTATAWSVTTAHP